MRWMDGGADYGIAGRWLRSVVDDHWRKLRRDGCERSRSAILQAVFFRCSSFFFSVPSSQRKGCTWRFSMTGSRCLNLARLCSLTTSEGNRNSESLLLCFSFAFIPLISKILLKQLVDKQMVMISQQRN
ncbi:unnamed protein product [Vicia faba]|uniref:Uncharacterized protein n=1 Tax=Vicia faba TaxID=3906 RepID=A0AAV0YDD3_VICFA|nr:unnamed protein product [Vicia faba]